MGKPTNTKNNGCAVTTSNCVVWQGPDLCCINLCEGDSISEVIDALAKKICALFEILDPSVYDVSSLLSGDCPPSNFPEVLQILIDAVIELKEGSGGSSSSSNTDCPTCPIAVAACFQEGSVNVMPFDDYVTAIGMKICDQQVIINTQNTAIQQLQLQLANMQTLLNQLISGG